MSERERKTRKATAKSNLNLLQHFSAAAAAYKDLDKNRKRERWRRKKNFCVYLVLMSYLRRLLWAVFVTTNIDEIQRFLGTKKFFLFWSNAFGIKRGIFSPCTVTQSEMSWSIEKLIIYRFLSGRKFDFFMSRYNFLNQQSSSSLAASIEPQFVVAQN